MKYLNHLNMILAVLGVAVVFYAFSRTYLVVLISPAEPLDVSRIERLPVSERPLLPPRSEAEEAGGASVAAPTAPPPPLGGLVGVGTGSGELAAPATGPGRGAAAGALRTLIGPRMRDGGEGEVQTLAPPASSPSEPARGVPQQPLPNLPLPQGRARPQDQPAASESLRVPPRPDIEGQKRSGEDLPPPPVRSSRMMERPQR